MNAAEMRLATSSFKRSEGFWLASRTRVLCLRLSLDVRSMKRRPLPNVESAHASSRKMPLRAWTSPKYMARWVSQAAR